MSEEAYQWPYQPQPTTKDKEGWRRVLQQVFHADLRYHSLPVKLGRYYQASRKVTKWLYEEQSESLYHKEGRHWRRWALTRKRTRTRIFQPTEQVEDHARRNWDTAIVTIMTRTGTVILEGHAPTRRSRTEGIARQGERDGEALQQRQTLEAVLHNVPDTLAWAIETRTLPQDNRHEIAARIIQD